MSFEWEDSESDDNSRSQSTTSTWASDDDYEKEAGKTVGLMFDAIDCHLYEGINLPENCKNLQNECLTWTKTFPHLRILGCGVLCSNANEADDEEEFKFKNDSNSYDASITSDEFELIPGLEPVATKIKFNPPNRIFSEEIIEVDGFYEDLIAFDDRDGLWSDHNFNHRQFEIYTKVKEKLTEKIFHKVIMTLLNKVMTKWVISCNITKENSVHLPNLIGSNNQNNKISKIKRVNDLQSLLTISTKTLITRNVRPPSVHTRKDSIGLGLGLPSYSACNKRLTPLDVNHDINLKSGECSVSLARRLPPIDKLSVNSDVI
ncbi:hypothetical protein CHUAL_012054 [Chamberlinius hualienensis]